MRSQSITEKGVLFYYVLFLFLKENTQIINWQRCYTIYFGSSPLRSSHVGMIVKPVSKNYPKWYITNLVVFFYIRMYFNYLVFIPFRKVIFLCCFFCFYLFLSLELHRHTPVSCSQSYQHLKESYRSINFLLLVVDYHLKIQL